MTRRRDPDRRGGPGEGDILRFEPSPPRAKLHLKHAFLVDGRLIQFDGQRWRDEDAWAAAGPCVPDPFNPGESVLVTLTSCATGEVSLPLSPEELAAWLGGRRAPESPGSA